VKNSLGLVEVKGLVAAVLVADTMAKTANISISQLENTKGLGWITIKVVGDIGAVNAAVSAGKLMGESQGFVVTSKVIPRPSESVEKIFLTKEKNTQKALGTTKAKTTSTNTKKTTKPIKSTKPTSTAKENKKEMDIVEDKKITNEVQTNTNNQTTEIKESTKEKLKVDKVIEGKGKADPVAENKK
jgi:microcompartment protein CcmL/EutN